MCLADRIISMEAAAPIMTNRPELVHFRDADTREPLCGGSCMEPHAAAANGVPFCAECVRLLTEQVPPLEHPPAVLRPRRK